MRISHCRSCHIRFRDGLTKCPICDGRTTYIIACPECGGRFTNNNYGHHRKWCKRVPSPDEMADMLDEDPDLTVYKLEKRYGVHASTINRHLAGTRWHEKRLARRGKLVSCNKKRTASFRWRRNDKNLVVENGPTTPCARCMVLGEELDDEGLCFDCLYEIREAVERAAKALGSIGPAQHHVLNGWDLRYLTRQIIGSN